MKVAITVLAVFLLQEHFGHCSLHLWSNFSLITN